MSRDEFPCIRYRRLLDYRIESRKFDSQAEFDAEGGWDAGWARSPKDVERDPHNPVRRPKAPAPLPQNSEVAAKATARKAKGA